MVEPQPSKLAMPVRSRSPAPQRCRGTPLQVSRDIAGSWWLALPPRRARVSGSSALTADVGHATDRPEEVVHVGPHCFGGARVELIGPGGVGEQVPRPLVLVEFGAGSG